MEYSVRDLVRILLKKWYIILAIMILIGGASVIVSQKSFQTALEQYEAYTTATSQEPEAPPLKTGRLVSDFQYELRIKDISHYGAAKQMWGDFLKKYASVLDDTLFSTDEKLSAYLAAKDAYAQVSSTFSKLLCDTLVLAKTQAAMDADGYPASSLPVAQSCTAEVLEDGLLRVTISGWEEEAAARLLDAYLANVVEVGAQTYDLQTDIAQKSSTFFPDKVANPADDSVAFSQAVMQKPDYLAPMIKTVGTAEVYAFVLACFGVLLVTFIKGSKKSQQ